jgi:RNA polymerase sigma-70 factor, ECF subfamily
MTATQSPSMTLEQFNSFFSKHWGRYYGLAISILRNPEGAEDAVQEAYLRAHQSLHRFEGRSRLNTWLHRLVVNVCKTHLRAAQRSYARDRNFIDAKKVLLPAIELPDAQLLGREGGDALLRALNSLDFELKGILSLRAKGLSYKDIAQAMDLPIGTVKSRLFRARTGVLRELRV